MGFEASDDKGATFLNRVITLKDGKPRKLEEEADSRHAEIIVADLGLQNSKGIDAPAAKLRGFLDNSQMVVQTSLIED